MKNSKRVVTVIGSGSTALADALKAALAKEGNGVVWINEASQITDEQYAAIARRPRFGKNEAAKIWINGKEAEGHTVDVIKDRHVIIAGCQIHQLVKMTGPPDLLPGTAEDKNGDQTPRNNILITA